jgi:hypothetical protein
MRRSRQVLAPLLVSTAAAMLTACDKPQRCADEQGREADPKFCANLPLDGTGTATGSMSNNGGYYGANGNWVPHYYRFYYGGSSNGFVSGGSYAPDPGTSYSIVGTSRGGFGSSFSGDGAHGGEAGE